MERRVVTILWSDTKFEEFAVIEINEKTLIHDKIISTLDCNKVEGDIEKAKEYFRGKKLIK
jgi:tellurite resistance protein